MPKMKRILICGQRNYGTKDVYDEFKQCWYTTVDDIAVHLMEEVFDTFPKQTTIIEGEYSGADTLARKIAEKRNMKIDPYPADWVKYGKAAGPIRNKQMVEEGNPDEVHAFFIGDKMHQSKGTKNMIKIAKDAGIPVHVHVKGAL